MRLVSDLLRAAGVAVVSLGTRAWPNGYGNHLWCGTYGDDGQLRSWMACEPSPDDPDRYRKDMLHAKVYAQSPFGLVDDVTRHFTPTIDLSFPISGPATEHCQLNALNSGTFVSVAGGDVHNGNVVFEQVGCRGAIVYSVSSGGRRDFWSPGPVQEIVPPFVVEPSGALLYLRTAAAVDDQAPALLTEEIIGAPLSGRTYTLQTWIGGRWELCTSGTPVSGGLEVPIASDRLYQLFSAAERGKLAPYGFPFFTQGRELRPLRGEIAR